MNTLNGDIPLYSDELVSPFETHFSPSNKKNVNKRMTAPPIVTENQRQSTFQSYVAE